MEVQHAYQHELDLDLAARSRSRRSDKSSRRFELVRRINPGSREYDARSPPAPLKPNKSKEQAHQDPINDEQRSVVLGGGNTLCDPKAGDEDNSNTSDSGVAPAVTVRPTSTSQAEGSADPDATADHAHDGRRSGIVLNLVKESRSVGPSTGVAITGSSVDAERNFEDSEEDSDGITSRLPARSHFTTVKEIACALGLDDANRTLDEVRNALDGISRRLSEGSGSGDPSSSFRSGMIATDRAVSMGGPGTGRPRSIFARDEDDGDGVDGYDHDEKKKKKKLKEGGDEGREGGGGGGGFKETRTILHAIQAQLTASLPVLEVGIREAIASGGGGSRILPDGGTRDLGVVKVQLDELVRLSRDVLDGVGKDGRVGRDMLKEVCLFRSISRGLLF